MLSFGRARTRISKAESGAVISVHYANRRRTLIWVRWPQKHDRGLFKNTLKSMSLVSAQQDLQHHATVVRGCVLHISMDCTSSRCNNKRIIKALQQRIFARFSIHKMIVTDDVTCFRSWHFNDFYSTLRILHITTSTY
jgi:hypothetical protein